MIRYFHRPAFETARPAKREVFEVTEDLLQVMSSTTVPEELRPLARRLGAGSAMSSPHLLLRDVVNVYDDPKLQRQVSAPSTAALLGGSISVEGQLEASGVTFNFGSELVGFVTFAIPAALLIPGGSFYLAYRLYRLVRGAASIRHYARVSRAAPHVATAVAASDMELTRDEARLLRDLLRARVSSPKARHDLLELELDPSDHQEAAFAALRSMQLESDDWTTLLSIAVATAHADDEYTGEERGLIERFRELTDWSAAEFEEVASGAESDYMLRCHLGEAMVRACHQIARAGAGKLPRDAAPLMDIVLCAAVPSDMERARLSTTLERAVQPQAMSLEELTEGASTERPGLFGRVAGLRSERDARVHEFGKTMALFLATLEQWRGWVVRDCRDELFALGEVYGLPEKLLDRWVREAHRNIEGLRRNWIAPRPWESVDETETEAPPPQLGDERAIFRVKGLAGGRFLFLREDTGWEWQSSTTEFDIFCRRSLSLEIEELFVQTDDTTYELLIVTLDAHDSEIRIQRERLEE